MSKLETLLLYQQTEQKKQELEQNVRSTPSRQKFNRLHQILKNQQATNQKLSDEMEEKAKQASRLAEQMQKLQDRIELETDELKTIQGDDESTAEEMTELRKDIEKLSREIGQAIREAKRLKAEIEKAKEEYQKTNQVARDVKKEYDQLRIVCEKERAQNAAEFAEIDAKLAGIQKEADPVLFSKYQKVRQHYALPVVPVVGGKCSGCNMSLPMVMLKKLMAQDAVIECENCGRILYSEEN